MLLISVKSGLRGTNQIRHVGLKTVYYLFHDLLTVFGVLVGKCHSKERSTFVQVCLQTAATCTFKELLVAVIIPPLEDQIHSLSYYSSTAAQQGQTVKFTNFQGSQGLMGTMLPQLIFDSLDP